MRALRFSVLAPLFAAACSSSSSPASTTDAGMRSSSSSTQTSSYSSSNVSTTSAFPAGAKPVPADADIPPDLPTSCIGQTYFDAGPTELCPGGTTYFLCDGFTFTEYDCESPGDPWSPDEGLPDGGAIVVPSSDYSAIPPGTPTSSTGGTTGSTGSTGSSSTGSSTPTIISFCQEVAAAECPGVTSLCTGLTETACAAAVVSECQSTATAAMGQGRQFQPTATAACISALGAAFSLLSTTSQTTVSWQALNGTCGSANPCPGSPNDLCAQVFRGTNATGDDCTTTYECVAGDVCGSFGTCGPESDQGEGLSCGSPGDVCVDGTVCTLEPGQAAPICTSGGALGQECNSSVPCATTAQCSSNRCVALGEAGAACASNAGCDPSHAGSAFCDTSATPSVCSAGYTFGAGAADCKAFGG